MGVQLRTSPACNPNTRNTSTTPDEQHDLRETSAWIFEEKE